MSNDKKIQLCVCYPTEKTQQLTLNYIYNPLSPEVEPIEIISITTPQTDFETNENIPKLNEIFHYLTTIEEKIFGFYMIIDDKKNIIKGIYSTSIVGNIQIQGLFEGIDNIDSLIQKINTLIQEIKANTSAASKPVAPVASFTLNDSNKPVAEGAPVSPVASSTSNDSNKPVAEGAPVTSTTIVENAAPVASSPFVIPENKYLLKPGNEILYNIYNYIIPPHNDVIKQPFFSRYKIKSVINNDIKLERVSKDPFKNIPIPSEITTSYNEFIKNIRISEKNTDSIATQIGTDDIKSLPSDNILLFVAINTISGPSDFYPHVLQNDNIISVSNPEVKSTALDSSININQSQGYIFYVTKINASPSTTTVTSSTIGQVDTRESDEPDITDEKLNELIQKLKSSNPNELSKDILNFMDELIKDLQEQITKTKSVYENLIKLGNNNNNNEELNNLLEKIDINSLKNIKNNSKTIQNFINTISNKISGDKTEIERKKAEIDKLYNELIDESTKLLNEIEQKKTSTISVQTSQSPVTQSIISTPDDISTIFKDNDEDYNIYISLNFYLKSGYILFNTYLRSGLSIDDFFANQDIMKEMLKQRSNDNKKYFNKNVLQKMIEYIDLTFEKYGETSEEEEKILYRGIRYDKEHNHSSTEDIQIEGTQKSFISTTSDIKVAQFTFSNTSNCCVLVLKLSKGIKFLNINEIIHKIYNKIINNYSNINQPAITSGDEMEILLPRNLYFLSKGIIQDKKTIPNIPKLLLDEKYKMTYYDINVYLKKPENTYLLQQTADGGNKKRNKITKKRHQKRKFRKTRAIK